MWRGGKRLLAIARPSTLEGHFRCFALVAAEADWSYSGRMFESLYQSFEDRTDPSQGAVRIAALRAEFARLELDGFLVPRADQHQNEYVPACEERLAWLSGFTGSAGLAIVIKDRAAIFVDGRYSLVVKDQVDPSIFKPVASAETSPSDWLEVNLSPGARLGYDPWLHTARPGKGLRKATPA